MSSQNRNRNNGFSDNKQEVVSITYEEIGLFPRSFSRVLDRFLKQIFSDVENLVIQEYRFYRYLFLTTFKSLCLLFLVPFFVNFLAKNYVIRPLTEYFWNTKQTEIFLNSHQQKHAFAELKDFEEKLYFESLIYPKSAFHSVENPVGEPGTPTLPPLPQAPSAVGAGGSASSPLTQVPSTKAPSALGGQLSVAGSNAQSLSVEWEKEKTTQAILPKVNSKTSDLLPQVPSVTNETVSEGLNKGSSTVPLVPFLPPLYPSLPQVPSVGGQVPTGIGVPFSAAGAAPSGGGGGNSVFPEGGIGPSMNLTEKNSDLSTLMLQGQNTTKPLPQAPSPQAPSAVENRSTSDEKTESLINSYTLKSSLFVYQTREADKNIQQRYQEKTIELAQRYNDQSIEAITNFFGDVVSLLTLFYLLYALEIQINITKSFLLEVFFGLDDSKKSLLILLVTDLLVGYHSSNLWELFFEFIFNHYGLPESQTGIFLLVATLPVLLDVLFKYLIFRHLNRSSPATVATYRAMIE